MVKKKATLRDVARQAGVSVATVSRVLNDSSLVTKTTREKVETSIDRLGFAPSAAARSLTLGRTKTIGALVATLDHAIFARFLNALEAKLAELGYSLVASQTGEGPEGETERAKALLNMGAEGLIISGTIHNTAFNRLIDRFDVPVIITSYFDPDVAYPTIGYDNEAIAQDALAYLQGLGHRRIAVIHGPTLNNDRTQARIQGLSAGQHADQLSFHPTDLSMAGGVSAAEQILKAHDRPTAILCLSDVLALGALFALQRAGIQVPEQISLMGFDNLEWSALSHPTLTSIDLPVSEMGALSATAICDWLSTGQRVEPRQLSAEIVERHSTRAIAPQ